MVVCRPSVCACVYFILLTERVPSDWAQVVVLSCTAVSATERQSTNGQQRSSSEHFVLRERLCLSIADAHLEGLQLAARIWSRPDERRSLCGVLVFRVFVYAEQWSGSVAF